MQVSLKPAIEKQSSPLVISKAKNGHHYLYVAIAGLFYDSVCLFHLKKDAKLLALFPHRATIKDA